MWKYIEIKKAFCYYVKQIDSMLPCVWFSNRSQKTSKCGKNISDTLGYASCATFLFLPHFDFICDLVLNRCMATWNLFVLYNNEKPFFFYFKIFQYNAKSGLLPCLCPAFAPKKAIWCDLWSIQNEAISLVAMRSKELWLVEKNRATVKPDSSVAPLLNENLQRKQNWASKSIQILKKKLEKSSQF